MAYWHYRRQPVRQRQRGHQGRGFGREAPGANGGAEGTDGWARAQTLASCAVHVAGDAAHWQPMRDVEQLIWEEWNVEHIARHAVTPQELEAICHGQFVASATYGGRLRLIGRTADGRLLTIILAPEGAGIYCPVTARPASRKERHRYDELHAEGGETP